MARGPGRYAFNPWWLAVAAVVGASAAEAQPNAPHPDQDLAAITEPLLASIEQDEARNGPLSANLIDPLISLGLAYQENDEHVLAIAVLDRALYLKRVNEGLFRLDQAALVERIIESERAIGRVGTVEQLEERLVELARRNASDPRAAPIFRDAAERSLDHYERYLNGDVPPELTLPMIDEWATASMMSLRQARRHYTEAIFALLGDFRGNKAEIAELEERLTRTFYLEASNRGRSYHDPDDALYYRGLVSYQRRVQYTLAGSPATDHARTLVEQADWSLLFSRNGTAVERYAKAYALLLEQRAPNALIEELFPSEVPVFLPTFESPLAGATRAGSAGYVDVDFEIGKYGQPRKVEIVSVAGDDAAAASKYVAAAINHSRFRPSPIAEGAMQYRLRYSLADGSLTPRL
jgi:hypothetical protein